MAASGIFPSHVSLPIPIKTIPEKFSLKKLSASLMHIFAAPATFVFQNAVLVSAIYRSYLPFKLNFFFLKPMFDTKYNLKQMVFSLYK